MAVDLDSVFAPRSIAILGASANPAKLGHHVVSNLGRSGFGGTVYPISRSASEIAGFRTVPSLHDLPQEVDLVLFSVPAQAVPDAVADAIAVGAKAGVVYSCGFAEAGDEGQTLQRELIAVAKAGAFRLIGPNCLGVANFHHRMNATLMQGIPTEPGGAAMISQSGAFGGIAFAAFERAGVGTSKFASIGNMADVDHAELLRYLGHDPVTAVIAAFIEGVSDVDDFLTALVGTTTSKPVVILKAGRSASGREAAISHTGSLAGDGRVWEALLREAGATVVGDTEELFDAAAAFARVGARLPRGRRLGIVTISGGPSVVAADACDTYGLELPPLGGGLEAIKPLVPPFASLRNPVDVTAQIAPENYEPVVDAVAANDSVDAILAINVGLDLDAFGQAFASVSDRCGKLFVGYVIAPGIEETFARARIPNFPSVERAVRAVKHLAERGSRDGRTPEPRFAFDPDPPGVGTLSETSAKTYLARHGVRVTREELVRGAEEALAAAERLGYPVALKVSSPEIAHKSERGGVLLDIRGPDELRAAFATFRERFPADDAVVQEMVPPGIELIIGGRRDPQTGPVVMAGFGGVLTEVLDDVVFCRVPTPTAAALGALASLRGQQLLDGYRNLPSVDRGAVAEVLERLSAILAANPDIVEVDLNPVIAGERGLIVADALIRAQ